jgi:hypothetical protein
MQNLEWRSWKMCILRNEQAGASDRTSELLSGGARYESRMGHRMLRLRCSVVFLSISRRIWGYYNKLGYCRFLPYPFHFIIHCRPVMLSYSQLRQECTFPVSRKVVQHSFVMQMSDSGGHSVDRRKRWGCGFESSLKLGCLFRPISFVKIEPIL